MALGLVLNRHPQAAAEDSPAFGAIAERFRRAGELERAVALCQEGLLKFPEHLSARVTFGWALLDLGRHKEAQAELERVIKRAPDNLAAIRGLAQLHDRMENADASDLHNPSAWQAIETAPEASTEIQVGEPVSAVDLGQAVPIEEAPAFELPSVAAAAAAPLAFAVSAPAPVAEVAFEAPAEAAIDQPRLPFGADAPEPVSMSDWQGVDPELPAVTEATPEFDAELERFMRAIGPPVTITVADDSEPVTVAASSLAADFDAPIEIESPAIASGIDGPIAEPPAQLVAESQAQLVAELPARPVDVDAPLVVTQAAFAGVDSVAEVAPEASSIAFEPGAPAAIEAWSPDPGLDAPVIEVAVPADLLAPVPVVSAAEAIFELNTTVTAATSESDALLDLVPASESSFVHEPAMELVELEAVPVLDLLEPETMPLTIDIQPEPTRHDVTAIVLAVRHHTNIPAAPAVAALEKFLRKVESRKLSRFARVAS